MKTFSLPICYFILISRNCLNNFLLNRIPVVAARVRTIEYAQLDSPVKVFVVFVPQNALAQTAVKVSVNRLYTLIFYEHILLLKLLTWNSSKYSSGPGFFLSCSVQKLCRDLQIWRNIRRCVHHQTWQSACLWRVLRPNIRRWGVESVPEETGRFCWFFVNWSDYQVGFGDVCGEFWLGLDKIHRLTSDNNSMLRADLEDFERITSYAEYEMFSVMNETDKYKLNLGKYSGNSLRFYSLSRRNH